MSQSNKTYRINANLDGNPVIDLNIIQDYDSFSVLSLNISQEDLYQLHSADYGVIAGRVLANGNFGVPNAKISIFIERDSQFNVTQEIEAVYPYTTVTSKNKDNVRYNLLPDEKTSDCHQIVGTFPNKTYLLAHDVLMEVFDKYYRYTCRTNNSGDYIICGVPVGTHTLHMDLDISDCGILSQRPRDFVYKGYNVELFESPNKFKEGTEYNELTQVFTQDQVVEVIPFWGNSDNGETIGITRADIEVAFKFEPTCVFIGSVVSDNSSNGISKKCVPSRQMGKMDELVTGEGTIEMIRKTPGGNVEEFQIKGTELINSDGVWCYQIPMNLDYMMTDEYGNMVPTDDPEKGIPTRTSVRFRFSMQDSDDNYDNYYRCKVLVPNRNGYTAGEDSTPDYNFGSATKDESFRDLYWNYVYTVKSYIPRIQGSKLFSTDKFSGFKACNIHSTNNPIPYNNIRIHRLPLMYIIMCALIKTYTRIVYFVNNVLFSVVFILGQLTTAAPSSWIKSIRESFGKFIENDMSLITIGDGLCPDMESWYFCPVSTKLANRLAGGKKKDYWKIFYKVGGETKSINILDKTLERLKDSLGGTSEFEDRVSIDENNSGEIKPCLTINTDYLVSCVEVKLAEEYNIINFDFYNDWINGLLYIPRFMRYKTPKKKYFWGAIKIKAKTKGCINNQYTGNRRYFQQCALKYSVGSDGLSVTSTRGCSELGEQKCHKSPGGKYVNILGKKGGIVKETNTLKGQSVFYLKPYEDKNEKHNRVYLFATDVVLLGSLNSCDSNGVPQFFKYLDSSSYILPPALAETTLNEEAYIYVESGGTVCTNSDNYEGGVNTALLTYSAETIALSGTEDSIDYETEDDGVVVTEAAGVAWNYTGPDQEYYRGKISVLSAITSGERVSNDKVKKDALYYPGGHFLGLSCTNSQTNIKSCVNLQRICEIGVTQSQRQEIITGYDTNNNTEIYSYMVPNGLISTDEVVNEDARSMFATMNMTPMVGHHTFDDGYLNYRFDFTRTNGFDGSIAKKIGKRLYNRNLSDYIIVEHEENTDPGIKERSFMRSLEYGDSEYMKFRFGGLGYRSRFAYFNGSEYMLPQYENSFYFYFGLHNGATAMDEFNKQFFSPCEGNKLLNDPYIVLDYTFSLSEGYQIKYSIFNFDDLISVTCTKDDVEIGTLETGVTLYSGTFVDIREMGTFVITATNQDGGELSDYITLTNIILTGDYGFSPFKFSLNGENSGMTYTNCNGRAGGYVYFNSGDLNIFGKKVTGSSISGTDKLILHTSESGYEITISSVVSSDSFTDGDDTTYRFFVDNVLGAEISVKIGEENTGYEKFEIERYTVFDNSSLDVIFNPQYLSYRNNGHEKLSLDEWK